LQKKKTTNQTNKPKQTNKQTKTQQNKQTNKQTKTKPKQTNKQKITSQAQAYAGVSVFCVNFTASLSNKKLVM